MPRRPNISAQTRTLLTALLDQPLAWQHGYELSKQTGLKSGTLYPLLMRLKDQGLLASRWEDSEHPGKPPRHVYRLAPDGVELARDLALLDDKAAARLKGPLGSPA